MRALQFIASFDQYKPVPKAYAAPDEPPAPIPPSASAAASAGERARPSDIVDESQRLWTSWLDKVKAKAGAPEGTTDRRAVTPPCPPLNQAAGVTVLDPTPPPPPPTALVGQHVTFQNTTLPGLDGESGYVESYDQDSGRYRVLLNNGLRYYFHSRHLLVTQPPKVPVPLPPMAKHPLPATRPQTYIPPPL